MGMDQKVSEALEKIDSCLMVVSYLELPNKELGRRNVVGVSCLKDEIGVVKVSVDDRMKIWKEHMEKLRNVENK